ncbi:hypothetical protein NDU88_006512 [Pleurodeles waltl]|uniref:Uncharacterized protein n=1 Tax=Pleurodeles waltl TaxID=8319 RepID=A0AAV7RRF1_PLEWA|nr:hypothetical protein NDU88_006512 [Pleurodeles waltl]
MSRGRAPLTSVLSSSGGRISPDSSRPACGRRLGSFAGRPVCARCVVGFRCTVLLIVFSILHSFSAVFMCNIWDFVALSGSFAGCGRSSL